MGTHQSRLDAKGRVSIPAAYRSILRAGTPDAGNSVMYLRPSHTEDCLEVWPVPMFDALAVQLAAMKLFSPERESFSAVLYNETQEVESDREGRIVIPHSLAALANITAGVMFRGHGHKFQIWEPEAGAEYAQKIRTIGRTAQFELPGGQNFVSPLAPGTPSQ